MSSSGDSDSSVPFLALGFHVTNSGGPAAAPDLTFDKTRPKKDYITKERGSKPEKPLMLPPGHYTMALHLMYDNPEKVIESDGTTDLKYFYEVWRLKPLGLTPKKLSASGRVEIKAAINFSTSSGPGDPRTYHLSRTEENVLELETIDLRSDMGDIELIFVGKFQNLFDCWDGPSQTLTYYIQVENNPHS